MHQMLEVITVKTFVPHPFFENAIALTLIVVFFPLTAEAASKHVRAGAAGNGSGEDWTNAYPSLPATLVRGNTYYIADGTYPSYNFDDPASGTIPIEIKKATGADHGTNLGWQTSYGDAQAIFGGRLKFGTSYWVFNGQAGGGPGSWKSGFGFKVNVTGASSGPGVRIDYDATNVTIRHVEVVGNGGGDDGAPGEDNDGINIYPGAHNATISYAYIHDMGRCIMFCSANNALWEYIYGGIFESSGEHSEVLSAWVGLDGSGNPGISNITIRYSIFSHFEGTGGLIIKGNGAKIYGNVFFRALSNTNTHPHGFVGKWTQKPLHNVEVYNNTFINPNPVSPVFGYYHDNADGPASNIKIKNNLIYRAPNFNADNWGNVNEHDYNHFVDIAGATWGEAHGTKATGDPFVDWQNGDFRVKAAIPSGAQLGAPYTATRGAYGTTGASPAQTTLAAPTNLRIQ